MTSDPRVDDYLAGLAPAHRTLLEHVRTRIAASVLGVEETISYAMPAYKWRGRFIVSFAGWKRHCSIYPLTETFLAEHADAVAGFDQTKGSLHFTPERPLPDAVLDALLRSRMADLEAGRR